MFRQDERHLVSGERAEPVFGIRGDGAPEQVEGLIQVSFLMFADRLENQTLRLRGRLGGKSPPGRDDEQNPPQPNERISRGRSHRR